MYFKLSQNYQEFNQDIAWTIRFSTTSVTEISSKTYIKLELKWEFMPI